MSKTFTSSTKCCATCANWGGPRVVKLGNAETDSPSTRGKCFAGVPGDATPGPTAMRTGCPKYTKWSALR